MKKKALFLLLLLLALLLIGGCAVEPDDAEVTTTQTGSGAQDEEFVLKDNIYLISYQGQARIVNTKGELLLSGDPHDMSIIYDRTTDKWQAAFIAVQQMEVTGELNDWGEPAYRWLTQLCDLDGNPLLEWMPVRFNYAWHGFITAYYYHSDGGLERVLIRAADGEIVLHDVWYERQLVDYLNINTNNDERFLLDSEGKLREIPLAASSFRSSGQYIILQNENFLYGVLDADWQEVLPFEYKNIYSVVNGYATVFTTKQNEQGKDIGVAQVIDLASGEVVLSSEGSGKIYNAIFEYCDGEIVIMREWAAMYIYYLADMELNKLSSTYKKLTPENGTEGAAAEYFLAQGLDGESYRLNRQGEAQKETMTWPESAVPALNDSYGNINIAGDDWKSKYSFIERTNAPYYLCQFASAQGVGLYDLVHQDGRLLVANMQWVDWSQWSYHNFDGQAIVCRKGFSVGVMGLNGEWIYEESVFNFISE